MQPRVDLNLVRQSLLSLADSAYFDRRLRDVAETFAKAIAHVLSADPRYDVAVERQFSRYMLAVQAYLLDSTTNEIPYEVVFCLRKALAPWLQRDTIIATQLTDSHNFHFLPVDPFSFSKDAIDRHDFGEKNPLLAMIGVPKLYAHRPVFCIPLYHELGHFVDMANGIAEAASLLSPMVGADESERTLNHSREYFADLFSACYVGCAGMSALSAIAPDDDESYTHPSTADRIRVVISFLGGKSHPIVDLFQIVLRRRGLPPLAVRSSSVDVSAAFDDLRTCPLEEVSAVHGVF